MGRRTTRKAALSLLLFIIRVSLHQYCVFLILWWDLVPQPPASDPTPARWLSWRPLGVHSRLTSSDGISSTLFCSLTRRYCYSAPVELATSVADQFPLSCGVTVANVICFEGLPICHLWRSDHMALWERHCCLQPMGRGRNPWIVKSPGLLCWHELVCLIKGAICNNKMLITKCVCVCVCVCVYGGVHVLAWVHACVCVFVSLVRACLCLCL